VIGRPDPQGAAEPGLTISPEERDALYSLAMDLLSGIASREAPGRIDSDFSDELRLLLDSLGDIGPEGSVELRLPEVELKPVIEGIRSWLPSDAQRSDRSPRTRMVARTCREILTALGGSE
jgi:hypothetical protein